MERALNLERIRHALGEGGSLPSPEELQRRLAQAEIGLFLRRPEIGEDLLATAWYLHAVGSTRRSLALYPVDRQLQAHQVASHIFDLALASGDRAVVEQREMTFAAQLGYMRGGLDPNSVAVYRRRPSSQPSLRVAPGEVSLDVGSGILALDRQRLFPRLDQLRSIAEQLRTALRVDDLIETPYGAAVRVIEGCFDLLVHLTYDRPERLERARRLFEEATNPPYAQSDLDSRWVAAHLRDVADDLARSSVWAHRPPSVPSSAAGAMTLGDPAVMCLWPPQLELLSREPNPLDGSVKRLVLSFPTSGGKTLIAQYLVIAHIASSAGKACIVVPTHSLGRELQRGLDRRLALLGGGAEDAGPLGLPLPLHSAAVVMTPEKLAAHLRNEPERLLREFSLFVFDEAHLIGDRERGWTLESALGFLHASTLSSAHRIVLLSAALGNRSHVGAWMSTVGAPAQMFHHDWRGPRRAHALFGTQPDWDKASTLPSTRGHGHRQSVPLHGTIYVRTSPGTHHSLRTVEPIGTLVLKRRNDNDRWSRDPVKSDPQYRIRARMASVLGSHGSVLVVEPTKQAAQRMAIAIASEIEEESPEAAPLLAIAVNRLGQSHPLIEPLRRGVGFHHSALPDDIQAELEDGIRGGQLRYLVATTTLVEGINFPVRSVLIGERGYRSGDDYVTTLDASRLLNAIGRAGRACRETEGWIVLALDEQFGPSSFGPLEVDDAQLSVLSRLSTEPALEALAAFEELHRKGQDAIMEAAGDAVADFISHVWFVATALDELQRSYDDPARLALESTLAWHQLGQADRDRWGAVAEVALLRYKESLPEVRRRWAKTGTSLNTASQLEELAREVRRDLATCNDPQNPVSAFLLVAANGRLDRLLSLREGHVRKFRPRRNAPASETLPIDVLNLTVQWLNGREFDELGATHLEGVPDETFRYEQLSEFVSGTLEHFLPWVTSTLVLWVNDGVDADKRLCPDLPAYLRYGVDRPAALELSRSGVRSRRLAHAVARVAEASGVQNVREWLSGRDVSWWRLSFAASPSELADLLAFTRTRDAGITSRVLAGETVELSVSVEPSVEPGLVTIRGVDEPAPARLGLFRGDQVVGYLPAAEHEDVRRLLEVGVPMIATLSEQLTLLLTITDPTQRPAWFS